ncbi:hypothetical protein NPIL_268021 [Nephila pilipes]|uniref:Uncharacterized protein n=1 Tax=Nephila pilipes TaxID=299642 RepID=A0A8X6QUK3_NEPPI|nr:hypothetical protein NPIL_268021 [Nephila pilipes]
MAKLKTYGRSIKMNVGYFHYGVEEEGPPHTLMDMTGSKKMRQTNPGRRAAAAPEPRKDGSIKPLPDVDIKRQEGLVEPVALKNGRQKRACLYWASSSILNFH